MMHENHAAAQPRGRFGLLDGALHRARRERRAVHRRESEPAARPAAGAGPAVAAADRHQRRHARSFKKRYGEATQANVIEFLTFDAENPNSICFLPARGARKCALGPRDHLSEMWEQVNSMYLRDAGAAAHAGPEPAARSFPQHPPGLPPVPGHHRRHHDRTTRRGTSSAWAGSWSAPTRPRASWT